MPSLQLNLGGKVGRAHLLAADGFETPLQRLSSHFPSSSYRSSTLVDVAIDELLAGLVALAAWPEPATVAWDPRLAQLAKDSWADAQAVAARLESGNAVLDGDPDRVPAQLGEDWKGDLTHFQRRDIVKLLSLRHGANFSVPGAGKTRVGLAVFQALRQAEGLERLLIVGPKSCYESWLGENEECLAKPLRMEVHGRENPDSAEALIVNYERLASSVNTLGDWLSARPSMLILDEAHRMKRGADGVYGSACMALGPSASRRLILTGTPAPNGARDLESLMAFVWPGHGRRTVVQAVGGGDLVKASRVLKPLFTRTTKSELGLPPVVTTIRRLPLPPLHREVYDALLGQFSARAAGNTDDFEALGKVLVYLMMAAISPALLAVGTTRHEPLSYRVSPLAVPAGTPLANLMQDLPSYEVSPKYRETLAIVAANAAEGRKTLVWSSFIRSINTLTAMLGAFSPSTVHGGTEDRDEQIRRFRDDPDCMVLISNPATLGEGISLHYTCHDAVFVDRDFAAGRYLQSLDRIHRLGLAPGTETRVTVLASDETIDEVIELRLTAKLDFMGRILDDPAVQELADLQDEPSISDAMDAQDLKALMGHLRGHSG